jgi:hypothetical protein
MADQAALEATLRVRLDKFDRQMKKAGQMADAGVKDIEARFERANPQLGRNVGLALGAGIAGAGGAALK